MNQKRPTPPPTGSEQIVRLRLYNKKPIDWAYSAEGFLVLYDPAVVKEKDFDQITGLQTVGRVALGWMHGQGEVSSPQNTPIIEEPQHWMTHSRADTAKRIAHLVRLGWNKSITILPMVIALNGADIKLRSDYLTAEEQKTYTRLLRARRQDPQALPPPVWITCSKGRLALTWDFLFGFTTAQKKANFKQGYTAEFNWPKGDYCARAYDWDDLETDEGEILTQGILQFERITHIDEA